MNVQRIFRILSYKWMVLGILILQSSIANAEWEPENICFDDDTSCLEDGRYQKLKSKVITYLNSKKSGCSFEKANLLMDVVLMTKPQVCVEIGVQNGASVLPVAATLKFLNSGTIYAVDAWSNKKAVEYMDLDYPKRPHWAEMDMVKTKKKFVKMLNIWELSDFCKIIHKSSAKAVHKIPPIDFLHLDGNYTEQGSLEDVILYLPKVKSGGHIVLSNFFTMINGKQSKLKSFVMLFDFCEIIGTAEQENVILFKKR